MGFIDRIDLQTKGINQLTQDFFTKKTKPLDCKRLRRNATDNKYVRLLTGMYWQEIRMGLHTKKQLTPPIYTTHLLETSTRLLYSKTDTLLETFDS
jgi:hypothetical protein